MNVLRVNKSNWGEKFWARVVRLPPLFLSIEEQQAVQVCFGPQFKHHSH